MIPLIMSLASAETLAEAVAPPTASSPAGLVHRLANGGPEQVRAELDQNPELTDQLVAHEEALVDNTGTSSATWIVEPLAIELQVNTLKMAVVKVDALATPDPRRQVTLGTLLSLSRNLSGMSGSAMMIDPRLEVAELAVGDSSPRGRARRALAAGERDLELLMQNELRWDAGRIDVALDSIEGWLGLAHSTTHDRDIQAQAAALALFATLRGAHFHEGAFHRPDHDVSDEARAAIDGHVATVDASMRSGRAWAASLRDVAGHDADRWAAVLAFGIADARRYLTALAEVQRTRETLTRPYNAPPDASAIRVELGRTLGAFPSNLRSDPALADAEHAVHALHVVMSTEEADSTTPAHLGFVTRLFAPDALVRPTAQDFSSLDWWPRHRRTGPVPGGTGLLARDVICNVMIPDLRVRALLPYSSMGDINADLPRIAASAGCVIDAATP